MSKPLKPFRNRPSVIALSALVAVSVGYLSVLPGSSAQAPTQNQGDATPTLAAGLIGTWILERASTPGSPSGVGSRLKMFTGTHWCVVQPDPQSGELVFQHGGRYDLDGDKMKTKTEFAGQSTKGMIGREGSYTIKVDGDTMTQADADGVFNETWKRVK